MGMLRSRVAGLAALLTLVALAPGAVGSESRQAAPGWVPGAQVGFWTGQNTASCNNSDPTTCPRDLSAYTPAVWRALRRGHGALYFDLAYTVDFGPGATRTDALPIIREANRLGIAVKAWFTAPLAHGTYANEDNADFEYDAVRAFDRWRATEHVEIPEVVFDLEFPLGDQMPEKAPIDPAHQCAAVRTYARTISWAHDHGLVISGTPMPFLLDDLDNGDMALADAIDAGPLLPHAYDHVYLQTYRTYSDTGTDYPLQYLRRMHHYFGDTGEISLGDTTMGPPYQSVDGLVDDVRAAARLGATAIPIFELASSVQKYGAAGIYRILAAGHRPMSPTKAAAMSRPSTMTTANLTFFNTLDLTATAASPSANRYPSGCSAGP
jgi:hypothetical protein